MDTFYFFSRQSLAKHAADHTAEIYSIAEKQISEILSNSKFNASDEYKEQLISKFIKACGKGLESEQAVEVFSKVAESSSSISNYIEQIDLFISFISTPFENQLIDINNKPDWITFVMNNMDIAQTVIDILSKSISSESKGSDFISSIKVPIEDTSETPEDPRVALAMLSFAKGTIGTNYCRKFCFNTLGYVPNNISNILASVETERISR